jgi:D-arginine dehydrogenase
VNLLSKTVDVVVIGAGIAGLSAAAEIAHSASVLVVEMESTPSHHSTGRSAAIYLPTYGPPNVRRLTAASAHFFRTANDGRSPTPLVSPRGVLYVAHAAGEPSLQALAAGMGEAGGQLELVGADEARRRCPALRPDWVAAGGVDHEALDIDVAATVAAYRSDLAAHGGNIRTDHRVTGLDRQRHGWTVTTTAGTISAGVIVNAAGAWVDEIAELAGLDRIGFVPKRRTMGIGPTHSVGEVGPHFVAHVDMDFYFGGEHGDVMFSPADETPSVPTDSRPDEIDLALAIERINEATTLGLRSVRRSWAGLRTFSPDGDLVIGPDPTDDAFIWCGGQGGYGIHTSAGAAMATAALTLGNPLPQKLLDVGIDTTDLVPRSPDI